MKNIPVLHQLLVLIEEILKSDAPLAGEAAASAAVAIAESDPKVQAITAASSVLLSAAQNLKAVINQPPAQPKA